MESGDELKMIEEDCDLRKINMTAVKAAQAAKEALIALAPSYEICKVVVEEYEESSGDSKSGDVGGMDHVQMASSTDTRRWCAMLYGFTRWRVCAGGT